MDNGSPYEWSVVTSTSPQAKAGFDRLLRLTERCLEFDIAARPSLDAMVEDIRAIHGEVASAEPKHAGAPSSVCAVAVSWPLPPPSPS